MRFITSQLYNQVYLAERKMETIRVFCDVKNSKNFKGLKLAKLAFFIATHFDESKKTTSYAL